MGVLWKIFKEALELPKGEEYQDYFDTMDISPPEFENWSPTERKRKRLPLQYQPEDDDNMMFFEKGLHQTIDRPETDRSLMPFGSKISWQLQRENPEKGDEVEIIDDSFIRDNMAHNFIGAKGHIEEIRPHTRYFGQKEEGTIGVVSIEVHKDHYSFGAPLTNWQKYFKITRKRLEPYPKRNKLSWLFPDIQVGDTVKIIASDELLTEIGIPTGHVQNVSGINKDVTYTVTDIVGKDILIRVHNMGIGWAIPKDNWRDYLEIVRRVDASLKTLSWQADLFDDDFNEENGFYRDEEGHYFFLPRYMREDYNKRYEKYRKEQQRLHKKRQKLLEKELPEILQNIKYYELPEYVRSYFEEEFAHVFRQVPEALTFVEQVTIDIRLHHKHYGDIAEYFKEENRIEFYSQWKWDPIIDDLVAGKERDPQELRKYFIDKYLNKTIVHELVHALQYYFEIHGVQHQFVAPHPQDENPEYYQHGDFYKNDPGEQQAHDVGDRFRFPEQGKDKWRKYFSLDKKAWQVVKPKYISHDTARKEKNYSTFIAVSTADLEFSVYDLVVFDQVLIIDNVIKLFKHYKEASDFADAIAVKRNIPRVIHEFEKEYGIVPTASLKFADPLTYTDKSDVADGEPFKNRTLMFHTEEAVTPEIPVDTMWIEQEHLPNTNNPLEPTQLDYNDNKTLENPNPRKNRTLAWQIQPEIYTWEQIKHVIGPNQLWLTRADSEEKPAQYFKTGGDSYVIEEYAEGPHKAITVANSAYITNDKFNYKPRLNAHLYNYYEPFKLIKGELRRAFLNRPLQVFASVDDRVLFLKQKFPNIKQKDIKNILDADPTPNKQNIFWIAKQLQSDTIRLPEDFNRVLDTLTKFEKVKRKQDFTASRDINQYNLFNDLEDAIDKYQGTFESNREQVQQVKEEGAQVIFEEAPYTIIQITSPEAACYYAKNTKWCVSDFDTSLNYIREGPLYLILKDNIQYALFHIDSSGTYDFRNPRDREMSLKSQDPILKKMLLQIGKSRYVDLEDELGLDENYPGSVAERKTRFLIKQLPDKLPLKKWQGSLAVPEDFVEKVDEAIKYLPEGVSDALLEKKMEGWMLQAVEAGALIPEFILQYQIDHKQQPWPAVTQYIKDPWTIEDYQTTFDNGSTLFPTDQYTNAIVERMPNKLPEFLKSVQYQDTWYFLNATDVAYDLSKPDPRVEQKYLIYLKQLKDNPQYYAPSARRGIYNVIISYINNIKKEYWPEAVALIPEDFYTRFEKRKYYKPVKKRASLKFSSDDPSFDDYDNRDNTRHRNDFFKYDTDAPGGEDALEMNNLYMQDLMYKRDTEKERKERDAMDWTGRENLQLGFGSKRLSWQITETYNTIDDIQKAIGDRQVWMYDANHYLHTGEDVKAYKQDTPGKEYFGSLFIKNALWSLSENLGQPNLPISNCYIKPKDVPLTLIKGTPKFAWQVQPEPKFMKEYRFYITWEEFNSIYDFLFNNEDEDVETIVQLNNEQVATDDAWAEFANSCQAKVDDIVEVYKLEAEVGELDLQDADDAGKTCDVEVTADAATHERLLLLLQQQSEYFRTSFLADEKTASKLSWKIDETEGAQTFFDKARVGDIWKMTVRGESDSIYMTVIFENSFTGNIDIVGAKSLFDAEKNFFHVQDQVYTLNANSFNFSTKGNAVVEYVENLNEDETREYDQETGQRKEIRLSWLSNFDILIAGIEEGDIIKDDANDKYRVKQIDRKDRMLELEEVFASGNFSGPFWVTEQDILSYGIEKVSWKVVHESIQEGDTVEIIAFDEDLQKINLAYPNVYHKVDRGDIGTITAISKSSDGSTWPIPYNQGGKVYVRMQNGEQWSFPFAFVDRFLKKIKSATLSFVKESWGPSRRVWISHWAFSANSHLNLDKQQDWTVVTVISDEFKNVDQISTIIADRLRNYMKTTYPDAFTQGYFFWGSAYMWSLNSEKIDFLDKYFTKEEINNLVEDRVLIVDKKDFSLDVYNPLARL